jgi:cobalt-zinc-cadmium efflux system outer membrane protein
VVAPFGVKEIVMWVIPTYRICLLVLLGLMLQPLLAWSAGERTLTLAAAIDRALTGNPTLRLSLHERQIEEGRLRQAGIRPRVGLDLMVENFLGSGLYDGVANSETTLSLVWVLERGKRQHRMTAAQAAVAATDVSAELRRLEVAADTADAFLEVLVDQERLALAREAVGLGEDAKQAVLERTRIGRSSGIDLARAEADLAWWQLAEEDVAHELLVSKRTLASRWGAERADFAAVVGDLEEHPTPSSYADLLTRVGASPGINQYLSISRLRQAELSLAEARSKLDWRLSTGARYLGSTDDYAFVAQVTLPIGRADPNLGRVEAARAEVALADAELVARRVEIEATLYRLHQELTHNLHRAEAIGSQVIPLLETVVADAGAAYAAGRFSYFELRQAQVALLDARRAFLQENYLGQVNRIAIERLTGTAVGVSTAAAEANEENP